MKYHVAVIEDGAYCVIGIQHGQRSGFVVVTDLQKDVAETMVHNLNCSIRTEKLRAPLGTKRPTFNFNLIYQEYPRKEGKTHGFSTLIRTIITTKDFEDCLKAAKNYREMVVREHTEMKFIKLFSTWANCWRDYVDREQSQITQPTLSFEEINNRIPT